jgi:hypothetical protein
MPVRKYRLLSQLTHCWPTALRLGALLLALALTGGLPILPIPSAFSQTRYAAHYSLSAYLRCTRDTNILRALELMGEGQSQASLNRIISKPVRVIFKDMKSMNKALANYDALSWISNQGEQVIFVNEKHQNAPPEALAALISHESMHDDEFNSLEEETQSWQHEARVWMEMKSRNPALSKIQPGQYPLVDRENRIEAEYRKGTLASFVRSSPGYRGLPETSPGFASTPPPVVVKQAASLDSTGPTPSAF